MSRAKLQPILTELDRQIKSSSKLVSDVKRLGLPRVQLEIIAELAFLRVFMAWENFLEESFVRYLVGGASPSGYRPKSFVHPPTLDVARKLMRGEREYVKWNSSSAIIARSGIYFDDGAPYKTALQGITAELDAMNIIRNRITHKSLFSTNKFKVFVRIEFGHGINGMTPGRLLLTIKHNSTTTYFDYYTACISTSSGLILR